MVTSEQILLNFSDLLIFGNQELSSVELNLDKTRIKKKVLYFIMCAAQSYSEGILKIIKPPSIFYLPAESLFRSLLEQYINIHLIYCQKSNKYAHLFFLQFLTGKVKFSNKNISIFTKYPKWKVNFGEIKSIDDWKIFKDKNKEEIKRYKKRYKIPIKEEYPNIEDCCRQYDNEIIKQGKFKRKKSLEDFYVRYYDYFSQSSHLNMSGLNKFFKQNKDGRMCLVIDGTKEDLVRTLTISYQFYLFVLINFLKKFGKYDKKKAARYIDYSRSLLK